MKRYAVLLLATLAFSPIVAVAQEGAAASVEDTLATEKGYLLELLSSKGFSNVTIGSLTGDESKIIITGLTGSNELNSFSFDRIEIVRIDPGYRWTKAEQVSFSKLLIKRGVNEFKAEAVFSNGFGILDVDSAQPGFAFDDFAVLNGEWLQNGQTVAVVPTLVAKGRQWKELYSIPATMDLNATISFSVANVLPLFGASLPEVMKNAFANPVTGQLVGRISSTTSSGALTASLRLKTDGYGDHKVETTMRGFDDALLSAYFARGDENVANDQEKLKALQEELKTQSADIAIRTLFYSGSELDKLSPVLEPVKAPLSAFVAGWVDANSSQETLEKHREDITTPFASFLDAPGQLQIDLIPRGDVKLNDLVGYGQSDAQKQNALDDLGIQVITR